MRASIIIILLFYYYFIIIISWREWEPPAIQQKKSCGPHGRASPDGHFRAPKENLWHRVPKIFLWHCSLAELAISVIFFRECYLWLDKFRTVFFFFFGREYFLDEIWDSLKFAKPSCWVNEETSVLYGLDANFRYFCRECAPNFNFFNITLSGRDKMVGLKKKKTGGSGGAEPSWYSHIWVWLRNPVRWG